MWVKLTPGIVDDLRHHGVDALIERVTDGLPNRSYGGDAAKKRCVAQAEAVRALLRHIGFESSGPPVEPHHVCGECGNDYYPGEEGKTLDLANVR